jgi:hypothetical protein
MPITFTVDHGRHRTRAVATGSVTFDEVREHLLEEREEHGLRYPEIIGATHSTVTFSGEEARAIVRMIRDLAAAGAFGPTAVIVSDDVSYGMMRMIEMLLGDVCAVRPFRAAEASRIQDWLDQSSPGRG